jgi:serine/threonine protein kinase
VKKSPYNGAKADIWALGILLYLMLVGVFPFRAGNEQELYRLISAGKVKYRDERGVSEAAKRLIQRMLAVQQDQRPTAIELLEDPWIKA